MRSREDADLLDAYLEAILRCLPGPRAVHRDIVDELRDGILEAANARCRQGHTPVAAMRMAIAQFGTADAVAAAYAPEIAMRQARGSAWRMLALLITAGITWNFGYRLALGVPAAASPAPGVRRHVFLLATQVIQWLPLVALVGVIGLLLASGPLGAHRRCSDRGCFIRLAVTVTTASLGAQILTMAAVLTTGQPALWMGARTLAILLLVALAAMALMESVHATRRICFPRPRRNWRGAGLPGAHPAGG